MAIDRQSEPPRAQEPAGGSRATAADPADPGSAALSPADLGGHKCRPNARPRSQSRDWRSEPRGETHSPEPPASSAGPPGLRGRGGGSWKTEREEGSEGSHPGFVAGHHQVCILVQNVDL